jgi:hypothetical protein
MKSTRRTTGDRTALMLYSVHGLYEIANAASAFFRLCALDGLAESTSFILLSA